MIHENIVHERMRRYKDNEDTSVALRVKDGKGRWLYLMGIYHQWKATGEFNSNDKEGICQQVLKLKSQIENINNTSTSIQDREKLMLEEKGRKEKICNILIGEILDVTKPYCELFTNFYVPFLPVRGSKT